jgi:predicted flap endonuclease-1-like 5' DNA nuclease
MDIDGIDEDVAQMLKAVGIRTTAGLLEAAKDAKGRKALAARTGLNEKLLLQWANVADRMRIKGIGEEYAQLLRAAGVDTVRELKHRNAVRLARAMKAANDRRKLVRFLPSEKHVTKWIEQAKKLPLKISY